MAVIEAVGDAAYPRHQQIKTSTTVIFRRQLDDELYDNLNQSIDSAVAAVAQAIDNLFPDSMYDPAPKPSPSRPERAATTGGGRERSVGAPAGRHSGGTVPTVERERRASAKPPSEDERAPPRTRGSEGADRATWTIARRCEIGMVSAPRWVP